MKKELSKEKLDFVEMIFEKVGDEIVLSGSAGLILQGVNIRSDVNDFDFFVPSIEIFNNLEKTLKTPLLDSFGDVYESEYFRKSFKIKGFKVDFFTENNEWDEDEIEVRIYDQDYNKNLIHNFNILSKTKIISFKLSHIFSIGGNPLKHKLDLIHLLVNN